MIWAWTLSVYVCARWGAPAFSTPGDYPARFPPTGGKRAGCQKGAMVVVEQGVQFVFAEDLTLVVHASDDAGPHRAGSCRQPQVSDRLSVRGAMSRCHNRAHRARSWPAARIVLNSSSAVTHSPGGQYPARAASPAAGSGAGGNHGVPPTRRAGGRIEAYLRWGCVRVPGSAAVRWCRPVSVVGEPGPGPAVLPFRREQPVPLQLRR